VSALEALEREIVECRRCPRLVAWREQVAREKRAAFRDWDYWGRPIAGFGDPAARVVLLGLAPAAHGANRTGRVFTGDRSGDFLFAALHRPTSRSRPSATTAPAGSSASWLCSSTRESSSASARSPGASSPRARCRASATGPRPETAATRSSAPSTPASRTRSPAS
jgi:uracil-DNA glycosylase